LNAVRDELERQSRTIREQQVDLSFFGTLFVSLTAFLISDTPFPTCLITDTAFPDLFLIYETAFLVVFQEQFLITDSYSRYWNRVSGGISYC
jgi:hypothetical protein